MEQPQELFSLSLDPDAKNHLLEAGRWAKILAVCGTIFLVLVITGLVIQAMTLDRIRTVFGSRSEASGFIAGYIIGYLIMLIIVFFPLLYLFRFSGRIKAAVESNDQQTLNESLRYIKIYFRYLGIITLIFLAIFGLLFLIGIIGRATS